MSDDIDIPDAGPDNVSEDGWVAVVETEDEDAFDTRRAGYDSYWKARWDANKMAHLEDSEATWRVEKE